MESDVVTKSGFAALIHRDPAFVTRAILSGKLHGTAIVGEGRSARIRVSVARQQLADTLDVSQQLAQPAPILAPEPGADMFDDPAGSEAPTAAPAMPRGASTEHIGLKNEKLKLEIARQQREDAIRDGQLVDAASVANALRRQLGPLVAIFDELGPAIAKVIAEKHGLDYAEVLISVNGATRTQRAAYAEAARALGVRAEAEAA